MKLFKTKRTFAQITESIKNTVDELRALAEEREIESLRLIDERDHLSYDIEAAEAEALEASLAADKIESLIK